MPDYDATLKMLLQRSADSVLGQTIGGLSVSRWLNVELPRTQTPRADLIGETTAGGLVHIELQSSNHPQMALRMAEYSLAICREFGQLPKQLALYFGDPPLRMAASLSGPDGTDPDVVFRYSLFDFRELDGTALLNSANIEDNVLSILARLRDQRSAIREILSRIGRLGEARKHDLLAQFLILSGLRKLGTAARQEIQTMPILTSMLEHDLFGPLILQGRAEGRAEGRADMLRQMMEKRFGLLPQSIQARLSTLTNEQLDDIAIRLLDAPNLESLF